MFHSGILYHESAVAARRRVRAPLPPRFLAEDAIAADIDAACRWVIYPVCFGSRLIADEDHGSAAIVKLLRVWTGNLDMDHAPEDPQVMYRRCGPIPQLVWRSPAGASRRRPVEDVDRRVGGLPQKEPGSPLALSMLLAIPTMVWFRRLATPFCCGVYGAVSWRTTPSSAQYVENSTEVNSPPRLVRRARSFFPLLRSAAAWILLMAAGAASLVSSSVIHMYLLKSSTRSRK